MTDTIFIFVPHEKKPRADMEKIVFKVSVCNKREHTK